jgi:hypothetical protein
MKQLTTNYNLLLSPIVSYQRLDAIENPKYIFPKDFGVIDY